ncbi:MAG TPA: M28 family metallopeptidase [Verrucomicrobiae bacterium]|nr:M28 family metallopeptidase [Verrucomicrobiae bacterium]
MRTFSIAVVMAGVVCVSAATVEEVGRGISGEKILQHIRVLADDKFEGRGPATIGEELTVNYLIEQFKAMGLQAGNPDGSWTQDVPMVGVKSASTISLTQNGNKTEIAFPQDYVGWSGLSQETLNVRESELVFVGYGVEAPEYGWDDYKGVDVRGKTLLMLVNDPAIPDAKDGSKLDERMFKGKAMTYYGRWTYKYEIAAKKGAAACFVIHETEAAGYPWFVVVSSNGRENFRLKDSTEKVAPFQGWMSLERTKATFAAAGQDFEALKKKAIRKDFRPVALGIKMDLGLTNTMREVRSKNVLAKLPGAKKQDELVIYTAHWDHIGVDPKLEGDKIFNGAMDNASGVATFLEIARAFAQMKPAPERTVLFLAVTAEEKGLLGAKYYAEHPLYPLKRTLANLNIDGASLFGRRSDLGVVGLGNSTLDDLVMASAKKQNRKIRSDLSPEKGFYYRSDHFEFAKVGVPALYLDKIDGEYPGKPADFGKQKRDEYIDKDYHKPSDEVKSDWDLTGAVDDARILFEVGVGVANGKKWPEWNAGTEFKGTREASLRSK